MTSDTPNPPGPSRSLFSAFSTSNPMTSTDALDAFEPTAAMRAEATRWLLRLREPQGPSAFGEFETWKAAHPAHEFAFFEVEAFFDAIEAPAVEQADRFRRVQGRRRLGVASGFARPWAIAAGLAATLVLALGQGDAIATFGSEAATGAGQTEALGLADGTRITLNTRTIIDDLSTATTRGARVRKGEAFFEVAKDPDRPFVVEAGDARVRVLGTRFNVRLDGRRVLVSVEEGRVATMSRRPDQPRAILTAGQEAVITADGAQRQPGEAFEVAAWRDGALVLFQTPLREVVAELNRYRRAPIIIADDALAQKPVTGVFDIHDTDAAVQAIEDNLGGRAVRIPGGPTFLY